MAYFLPAQPLQQGGPSSLWNFCPTQDMNFRMTSIQSTYNSFLEDEGLRNKNKANFGIRSRRLYRSSTRLPAPGGVARVPLWGVFCLDAAMVSEAGVFLVGGGLNYHRRSSNSLCPMYCGLLLPLQNQAGSRGSSKSEGMRLWELRG